MSGGGDGACPYRACDTTQLLITSWRAAFTIAFRRGMSWFTYWSYEYPPDCAVAADG
jgi:hypothetical protein